MIWQGATLADASPATFFDEETGQLHVGTHVLRFVSDTPSDVRAVDADGTAYRLVKRSITVTRYEAICGGRSYQARRTGAGFLEKRRAITDETGALVASTIGLPNGDLVVAPEGELTLDLAFISWALTYVDAPVRRTLY
ncbi:hypothetical protein M5J20_01285 [Corynebacterium sp. TA-R-1]|uniref:Uncharacterized protein n=1 Tax=Corynebacterium stercoris TaxID=2943490 RepID=A0ABT1G1D8_9CORY|nr:hypothetical protein [Corynebacterium stercoris]MCP1386833.1 hypothetical protein [Corynebacterium stercoris]